MIVIQFLISFPFSVVAGRSAVRASRYSYPVRTNESSSIAGRSLQHYRSPGEPGMRIRFGTEKKADRSLPTTVISIPPLNPCAPTSTPLAQSAGRACGV